MNQTQNPSAQKAAEEAPAAAPERIEVKDLEPEQDVSGGTGCANNLKQMGIG